MLNHTSLQLSDVLPKKHLNLQHQLWPIDQWTMQWSEQRWRECWWFLPYLGRHWEVEEGGAPPSQGGGIASSEKKYLDVILHFLSLTFLNCKAERNPNAEKALMGWLLILQLLRSGSQTVKWCLCWQMCFYPRTNLFAHCHKYVSHQLTNILSMVPQIYQLPLTNILQDKTRKSVCLVGQIFSQNVKIFHFTWQASGSLIQFGHHD